MKSDDGETVKSTRPHGLVTSPAELAAGDDAPLGGLDSYALGALIGRGGMGEVLLARDRRIGRDVAIKRLKPERPTADSIARFLREAKIQAQLDHPAIVPVHELGRDPSGLPFFTMKRLTGITLAELLARGPQPLQRLLRAFVDVALAVEFAHSRGIVHRDLKPANVMLGDFGEVYVLDWGLARVLADAARPAASGPHEPTSEIGAKPDEILTESGAMLGTPGYMSPEQIRDAGTVEAATDSYALGSILFELLAGEPLHARAGAVACTLAGIDGSPSRRRIDRLIPPELDALCVAALAEDPTKRPTARALADRVQSYLDGDRDLALRREMARDAVVLARGELVDGHQGEAMRAAARALALDPHSEAAEIVTRLMLEPPKDPPPELRAELRASDASRTVLRARKVTISYLTFFVFLPIAMWNGVTSWPLVGSISGLVGVLALCAHTIARRPDRSTREMWLYLVGNAALLSLLGVIFGPFLVAPGFGCLLATSIATYPAFVGRVWLLVSSLLAGWLLPIVLEAASLVPSTWALESGTLVIRSHTIVLAGPTTIVLLFGMTIGTIVISGLLAGTQSHASRDAQNQLLVQRWQLSQLLPSR